MKAAFYILQQPRGLEALRRICNLVAEKYAEKLTIFIYTEDPEEAKKLDELLWTFGDISFIPHALASDEVAVPIKIGDKAQHSFDALLNLSDHVPADCSQFPLVLECVYKDPELTIKARERFKIYRENGYEIKTYQYN